MEHSKTILRRMLFTAATMLFALTISAQTTIKGHVKDDTGEDVIGASIVVKGTQGGTVTDFDGNFAVQCQPGATLVITYIGFVPQEVKAKDGMDITLHEDVAQLNEVVVVGYGSLAKKEISSSVVQISKDQFNAGATSDPMGLVAGKVAGLNVASTAGANPNAMTDIQIRGASSFTAGNGPLIVIDGIPGGDLRNVATQDVESITVLKDAGSAAIYGTRGANGVILVTTKKGSGAEGVVNVNYDSYIALNIKKPHAEVLSADEFRRSRRGTDFGYDTDWYSEITRDVAYILNQYVSIDGTTKNGYYGASLNYKQSNGLDIASGRKEYGGRFVLEQRILDRRLTFNGSLSGRKVHEDWSNGNWTDRALSINPTMPVYNPDGTFFQPTDGTGARNPVEEYLVNKSEGNRLYVLGNADAKLNIITSEKHNLNTSISYSLQYNDLKQHYYTPTYSIESKVSGYEGRATIQYQKWWTDRFEWLVNYALSLRDHELKVVAGYSWERTNWEQTYSMNRDFAYDDTMWHLIGSGKGIKDGKAEMSAGKSQSTLVGFFGRANYNWKDMIFASASLRYEGSSKFGADKKWGTFPSVSLAWEMTKAPFLGSLSQSFQSLKPRVSYGVTGRSDFGAYQSITAYNLYGEYFFDGQWINGYAPYTTDENGNKMNANPGLQWEKSTAFNVGIDFVTLKNRLRGSIEFFDRRSEDLLYTYQAPQPPYAWSYILVNVGTTKNTGIELSLDYDVLAKKDLKWTTGVVYSYGTTKFSKLSNDTYQSSYIDLYKKPGVGTAEYFFRVHEGGKVGEFFGYEYAGIDENGNMLVYNANDETVAATKATPADKRYIGNGAPKHFLTWNNSFNYKQWDLSFMFRGAFGHKIFNMRKYGMGLKGVGTDNVLRTAYTDDKNMVSGGGIISSYFLEKGDYFKLEDVTLGYTFPLKNKKILENLRLYLAAKNLFTITGYSGNDPSIVPQTGITPGVDTSDNYPTATQLTFGVSLRFH